MRPNQPGGGPSRKFNFTSIRVNPLHPLPFSARPAPRGPSAAGLPRGTPPRGTAPRGPPPSRPPSSVGRALPPGAPSPGGVSKPAGPPGRSAGPPGRTAQPPAQERPVGGGTAAVGRALYRAEHKPAANVLGEGAGSSGPSGDDASGNLSKLTLGSRSSAGERGNGSGYEEHSVGRGLTRGATYGARRPLIKTRGDVADKKGTSGIKFNCMTNYFRMIKRPDWKLFQYRVDISPEEDRTFERKMLLKQHNSLGRYIFDGTVMYTPERYNPTGEAFELTSKGNDGQFYQITIKRVGELNPTDHNYLQFFNIMVRKIMQDLDLQLVHRNYYDSSVCYYYILISTWLTTKC